MPNRLIHEASPYLRQHAHNPVDWYPWGPEALEKARREHKPIFLSIGYASCHWCHVMAHESFEDPEVAALLNEHFVPIKVDREERPDLDALYMSAVVALTGQGGWPLNVFLTPEGQPFYGGTYFPPEARFGLPGFKDLLREIIRSWEQDRARIYEAGEKAASHIAEGLKPLYRQAQALHPHTAEDAVSALLRDFDRVHGGFHYAPKFPQPLVLHFLLARAQRGDDLARSMALHTLVQMARGGMYDVLGGGFHRYSTDDLWRVPHFEKMLYDNALLARAYLHGHLLTGEAAFRRITEATLDFILREMTGPQGEFYSALDADSEGEEGRYYTWTPEEVRAALGDDLAPLFLAAYDITPEGQLHGRSVPRRVLSDAEVAERFGLGDAAAARAALEQAKARLREARATRPRPETTPQAPTAWNALALHALAEAGFHFARPDYLEAARRNARFIRDHLWNGTILRHIAQQGHAKISGYLNDYAALGLALLALYQATGEVEWFAWAEALAEAIEQRFADPDEAGYFDTASEHDTPLARFKDPQDGAVPSGNSLTATFYLRLAAFTGHGAWRQRAEVLIKPLQAAMARYPTGFGQWLVALDFALGPQQEIAILGDPAAPETHALLDILRRTYLPRAVWSVAPLPLPPGTPALFHDRKLKDGHPTAYVCQHFVCRLPVTTPEAFREQLTAAQSEPLEDEDAR